MLVRPELDSRPPARQPDAQPTEPPVAVYTFRVRACLKRGMDCINSVVYTDVHPTNRVRGQYYELLRVWAINLQEKHRRIRSENWPIAERAQTENSLYAIYNLVLRAYLRRREDGSFRAHPLLYGSKSLKRQVWCRFDNWECAPAYIKVLFLQKQRFMFAISSSLLP